MTTKFKICISGPASNNCSAEAQEKAEEVGAEVARRGAVVLTGATAGIPAMAAKGAKRESGIVIGFSPAASEREHVEEYKLPFESLDMVIYTGLESSGRNALLARSADAVIEICGRVEALNEFTVAVEEKKIIGVLLGTGNAAEEIKNMLKAAKRGKEGVILGTDPKKLVQKIFELLEKQQPKLNRSAKKPKVKVV